MKGVNFIVICAVFVLMCCSASLVSLSRDDNVKISPKPAHSVLSHWYRDNGRRFKKMYLPVESDITVCTKVKTDCKNQCVIICSENLAFTLYTKGKVLYSTKDGGKWLYGKRTTVIDASDINRNKELYLHLTPIAKGIGRITEPIYLTTNNDYIVTLLSRERATLTAATVLFAAIIICLIAAAVKRNKKFSPLVYAACFLTLCLVSVISRSEVSQLLIGKNAARYMLCHVPYMLLSVPLLAFLQSVTGRNRYVCFAEIAVFAVTLLVILMFALFGIHFETVMPLAHTAIAASVILTVIITVKDRLLKRSFVIFITLVSE